MARAELEVEKGKLCFFFCAVAGSLLGGCGVWRGVVAILGIAL